MRSRRTAHWLAVALSTSALAVGCTTPRTEVVVEVASDLAWGPGADVQSLHIVVRSGGPGGTIRDQRSVALGQGAGFQTLPATFGIVPLDEDSTRTVWIEVDACGASGCDSAPPLTLQRALVGFAPRSTVLLQMFLAGRCRDVTCTMPDQTCDPATQHCVDAHRDVTTLPMYTADAELPPIDATSADVGAMDVTVEDSTTTDATNDVAVDAADGSTSVPVEGVTVGDYTACRWHPDGTTSCWGGNHRGELGTGSTGFDAARATPASRPFLQVDVGTNFTCGISPTHEAVCWGTNYALQLGRDTGGSIDPVPHSVPGVSMATQVAAGNEFACALVADGTVRCWGNDTLAQLGNGQTASTSAAVTVSNLVDAVSVSVGYSHACAVRSNGTAVCWGDNSSGQIGNGTTGTSVNTPAPVANLTDVVEIHAGGSHTCARTRAGDVLCWGGNDSNQLANGTFQNSPSPVMVLSGARALSTGSDHSCAITTTGGVKCWGGNYEGQLGAGDLDSSSTPRDVVGISNAVAIDSGRGETCALLADGTVKCWGNNWRGGLGNGAYGAYVPALTTVPGAPANIIGVAAGDRSNCVQLADYSVQCVGDGPLSTGPNPSTYQPVAGAPIFNTLTVGDYHACGTDMGLAGYCWGHNDLGQLGDGTMTTHLSTTPIAGGHSWMALRAGDGFTCGIDGSSRLYCWGDNSVGQLGTDTTGGNTTMPSQVSGSIVAITLDVGNRHACATAMDGTAWCWGANTHGQLGDGTTADSNVPVQVTGGLIWLVDIECGGEFTCARDINGAVFCWGAGFDGQVGDGMQTDTVTPKQVMLPGAANDLFVGADHACAAVTLSDTVNYYCWGANYQGQLGTTAFLVAPTPYLASTSPSSLQYSAGDSYMCAVDGATLRCTGLDLDRQFGAVTMPAQPTPELVLGNP